MSVRGGRASTKGLAAAALALLFLLPLLPVTDAQAPSDPWWGPSDRTRPTQGWAVRVPVVVENTYEHSLFDPFVAVDLDFAKLLVAAGWTNQTVGADVGLAGFTLDVDSIRVVEYSAGFTTGPKDGAATKPTPHVFYTAPFETKRTRDFDAARNPVGTVLFQVQGFLAPDAKRYFYVYANPTEYGDIPPATFDAAERAPLDAFLWGTQGNVYYGWEPQQDGQQRALQVIATSGSTLETTVTFYTLELDRYVPVPSTSTYPNPMKLGRFGQAKFYVPSGKAFKVEADRPISLMGHGPTALDGGFQAVSTKEAFSFIPGTGGSFADDTFYVYGARKDGNGQFGFVTAYLAGTGTAQVFVNNNLVATLTPASPIQAIRVPTSFWSFVSASGSKILLSNHPQQVNAGDPFHTFQVPALTGGPSGVEFYTPLVADNGWFQLCPEGNTTLRGIDMSQSTLQVFPEGTRDGSPPAILGKLDMCHDVKTPASLPSEPGGGGHTFDFYATKEDRYPVAGAPVPFRMLVGAEERVLTPEGKNLTRGMIGHYGGLHGTDYYVEGRTGIFGHYNDTRITVFVEKEKNGVPYYTSFPRGVNRDGFLALQPNPAAEETGRYHIVSNKPIAVASLDPAMTNDIVREGERIIERPAAYSYIRYVPGRPMTPEATLGPAEFRGPLVDLRSPIVQGRQLIASTGPATPLDVQLDVFNLGRWTNREGLADTVTLGCTTPAGWVVDGCAREVALQSGSAERVTITITPSAEDVNATKTIEVEARSKAGGATAKFKILVYVEVRYGVGLWFDVEGGRKRIDPPVGLDPGETYRYDIVLKNTGSTADTFALRVEDPREGWEQALLLEGEPVTSVRLEGGDSALLAFRVKAPPTETAPQNLVIITAQSEASALAVDKLDTATRIRPKVDLRLSLDPTTRLAEPNETAVFNVTASNKGNDVFNVLFLLDSVLPKGWNASFSTEKLGNEIALNPNPEGDPRLDFTLQLYVTPPLGARAGDLATLKVRSEIDTGGGAAGRAPGDETSAVVVVRRVHNLTTPPSLDAVAQPGASFAYVLPVTNHGNGQDVIELLDGAVQVTRGADGDNATPVADWRVVMTTGSITAPLNETVELPLRIDVPTGTAPGAYNLTFTTRLSRESLQNLTVPVVVAALPRVEFRGPLDLDMPPGRPVQLAYRAENTGNVEGVFAFSASAPAGWNVTFVPATARLAPGESVPVAVTVNASREASDGSHAMTLLATLDGARVPTDVDVAIARPQLAIKDVRATGALRSGELVLVTATVENTGAIAAENVSVALVRDGAVLDRVVLSRVPVGQSAVATLSWVATGGGGSLQVVLDPEEEIVQASRDGSVQGVQFASRVPGFGLALALASALAVAFVLRRPRA